MHKNVFFDRASYSREHTFPVVCPWGPKQNKIVVWRETDGKALLAEAKLLMPLRPALAELPLPSVQVISLCQILTQDIAAPDGVTGFRGFAHALPELVKVGAGLVKDRKWHQKNVSKHAYRRI